MQRGQSFVTSCRHFSLKFGLFLSTVHTWSDGSHEKEMKKDKRGRAVCGTLYSVLGTRLGARSGEAEPRVKYGLYLAKRSENPIICVLRQYLLGRTKIIKSFCAP